MPIFVTDCAFHHFTKLPIEAGTLLSFYYGAYGKAMISKRMPLQGAEATAGERLTSHAVRIVSDGQKREVFNR